MYEIDRKTASKMLKVTIRTVDRYIASKKLSSEQRDGRIWLDKKELMRLRAGRMVDRGGQVVDDEMSIEKGGGLESGQVLGNVQIVSTAHEAERSAPAEKRFTEQNTAENTYRKLFEEQREELKAKQDRLEGANYRVGQLEAMLKDTVPLLEHQKLLLAERSQINEIRQSLDPLRLQNEQLNENLKNERFNKKTYLIILFIIMLLQPLWLVLSLYK